MGASALYSVSLYYKGMWQQQSCSYCCLFVFSDLLTGCSIILIPRCPDFPSLCFPAPCINHLLSPLSLSLLLFLFVLSSYFFLSFSALVAADLYLFILLFIFISLVNYPSLSIPWYHQYHCLCIPYSPSFLAFSPCFLGRSFTICILCMHLLCACRQIKRIADTKHQLCAGRVIETVLLPNENASEISPPEPDSPNEVIWPWSCHCKFPRRDDCINSCVLNMFFTA